MEWLVVLEQKNKECERMTACNESETFIINAGAYDEVVREVRDAVEARYIKGD